MATPVRFLTDGLLHPQPERRIGPQLCPLTLRIPWVGRGTEKLVERANDAVRLAYFAGKVRAVYKTKRAFNLPKERIPPHPRAILFIFLSAGIARVGTWGRHRRGLVSAINSMYQSILSTRQPARNAAAVHPKCEKSPLKVTSRQLRAT